jgi:hypothetical protein
MNMRKQLLAFGTSLTVIILLLGVYYISFSGVTNSCLVLAGMERKTPSVTNFYFQVWHQENSTNCCNHSPGTIAVYYRWMAWIETGNDANTWKDCSGGWQSETLTSYGGCWYGLYRSSEQSPPDLTNCKIKAQYYFTCSGNQNCFIGSQNDPMEWTYPKDVTGVCEDCP